MTEIDTKIQDLAEDYKNRKKSLSEKDKAFLEQIVWKETVGSEIRKEKDRAEFLKELLGGTNREYYERAALINAGDSAEALWLQIEKHGMLVSTAVRLYRDAKAKAFKGCISTSSVLESVIAEYLELSPTYLPSGKVIRKKSISRLPSIDEIDKNGNLKTSKSSRTPKRFRTKLRTALAPILAIEFEGVEQIIAEKLWRELEIEINSLLDDFKSKLYRAKQDVKRGHATEQKLSFNKILNKRVT